MPNINISKFTQARGNPNKYSSGVRRFAVDGKIVQIHAPSWKTASDLILKNYPNALSIELLP